MSLTLPTPSNFPPHTMSLLPVHTAVCSVRAEGASVVLNACREPGQGVGIDGISDDDDTIAAERVDLL